MKFSKLMEFLRNDLKKDISKEEEKQILDKFHIIFLDHTVLVKDEETGEYDTEEETHWHYVSEVVYWCHTDSSANYRNVIRFKEGLITKKNYEKIKKLKENHCFVLNFSSNIHEDDKSRALLQDIDFSDDIDDIIKYHDNKKLSPPEYDLMSTLEYFLRTYQDGKYKDLFIETEEDSLDA